MFPGLLQRRPIPDHMLWADIDRRRRLVERHHLRRTAVEPLDVASAMGAIHSSDPITPYLGCWARVDGFRLADLESALYDTRSLLRMHTVRRTLFVVRSDESPIFEAAAARDIARKETDRLASWLEMAPEKARGWLDGLSRRVLEALEGTQLSVSELTQLVPELGQTLSVGSGKWAATVPLSSRLLYLMAMDGAVVRARPAGTWRSSQYRWARTVDWLGSEPKRMDEMEGRIRLAERYIRSYGPVTLTDLRWWTGWTVAQTRGALSQLDVTNVEVGAGTTGMVLTGDADFESSSADWVIALLPSLDPTVMGWKERDWYLGSHGSELFDSNGNAGPTVWVGGRVVGGWGQDPAGEVIFGLVEEIDSSIESAVADEAARLTEWLDGTVVMPRFPSPLGRRLASGT